MMKRLAKTAVAIASAAVIAHAAAQEIPSETWMGVYLGEAKIGYAKFLFDKADFQGESGYKLDSTSLMRVLVLGQQVEQNLDTTVYLNKEFEPMYEAFKLSSAGHTTSITAKFGKEEIAVKVESEGTNSTVKIPIPPNSRIVGDKNLFASTMKVGDKLHLKSFNAASLSLDDVEIQVLRKEKVQIGNETLEAFVIRSQDPLGETLCWQDDKGMPLKMTTIMGISMVREPKEAAMSFPDPGGDRPPSDVAVLTSIPTAVEIPNPRRVKYMKIRLSGLADRALAINDRRQKVKLSDGEPPVAEYQIRASAFSPARAVSLPIKDSGMEEYLGETPYIQPADPEIAAAARKIVGNEKNAYKAASRLRAWVNGNMKSKGDIGVLRSSVDLLRAKTGVCRDSALLYTALARAVGIPTKLVVGLIFWTDGFYNHAWAESFVGQWVPMDPTLPTDFVDATHIKLAEGDTAAMFDAAKTVGTLKAESVEFR